MSRPSESNKTQTTIPTANKATEASNLVHPQGHTVTIYADRGIWDETAGKAILPQDLVRP